MNSNQPSMGETVHATSNLSASLGLNLSMAEVASIHGVYNGTLERFKPQHEKEYLQLFGEQQELIRLRQDDSALTAYMHTLTETVDLQAFNVVTTPGKNFLLDNGLAGSAYTAAFYMGIISGVSFVSAPVIGDTAASHTGWTEAGGANAPTYTGARKTAAWAAAAGGSKSLSTPLSFTFNANGIAKGIFLSTISTVDTTTGLIYSAGLFAGGDQTIQATNILNVSYTANL